MATYFAAINAANQVVRVVSADQSFVDANGGDQSESAANAFEKEIPLKSGEVKYVQTSKTRSFRKNFAGVGMIFDSEKNIFLEAKPYPSWSLNENNEWEAPVAEPTIKNTSEVSGQRLEASPDGLYPAGSDVYYPYDISWDENNQKWIASDRHGSNFQWNTSTLSWDNN